MPTTEANAPLTNTPACPLCAAPLDPANPNACPKCDWVARDDAQSAGNFRDKVAVGLSVIPGLGHLYKGHRLLGALFIIGSVFAGFASLLAGFASAGWGTLLLPLYWLGVMLHVFFAEDLAAQQHARKR